MQVYSVKLGISLGFLGGSGIMSVTKHNILTGLVSFRHFNTEMLQILSLNVAPMLVAVMEMHSTVAATPIFSL